MLDPPLNQPVIVSSCLKIQNSYVIFLSKRLFFFFFVKACAQFSEGECLTIVDGYFVEVGVCTVAGIIWYLVLNKIIEDLQSRQLSDWLVNDDDELSSHSDVHETYDLPDLLSPGNTPRAVGVP